MPIYHYPGYITKEHYAKQRRVKVRAVNDWIMKRTPSDPAIFIHVKVDGYVCIKDLFFDKTPPREGISLNDLEGVRNFAKKHKMNFPRVLEDIIAGKISGVILAERIFIIKTEPQLIEYVANYKRKRAVGVPYYLKQPKIR